MASKRRLDAVAAHLKGRPDHSLSLEVQPTSATGHALPTSYCMSDSVLTTAEKEQYARDGFIVKKGLIDLESAGKYRERFRQICAGEVPAPPGLTVMRDVAIARSEFVPNEKAVTKIQHFQHDDVLFEYCAHPAIVPIVEAITGPDIMAMHTMLINKPPDAGTKSSRHPLHQDLHYFSFRPANRIVASWTALEHVHRGNGCLVVHPGSHAANPLLPHDYPEWKGGVNKLYHGIPEETMPPAHEMVHLEMQEGDTVFFHPLLIHGSGVNRSSGFRKAISCHYASSHCLMVDAAPTQMKLKEEINEVAQNYLKKKGMEHLDLTFQDSWRFRSRLVAGSAGCLTG